MNDAILGSGVPATLVYRLWLVAPALDGTGGSEVAGNGYVAPTQANNGANFPASVAGVKTSAAQVAFPAPTGPGWGAVVASSVHDNSNNDLIDLVVFANVPLPPVLVAAGDSVTINAADYTVTVR